MLRAAIFFFLILCFAITTGNCGIAARIESELGEKEIKLGKESAEQIAKEYKLSNNTEDLKRVREIGAKIAEIANKTEIPAIYGSSKITPFEYTFNIIEEEDINAFSVPGGFIYIYRGLLNFVESDHELAGVIAHEIVHAAHHHMVFLLQKQAKLNNQLAIALLAAMLSGSRSTDVGNVLLGAQLYQIAILNGYGMEAEKDADRGAIFYMKDAGYNPVGLLTFLERLASQPKLIDYGIYRSHPLDVDRVRAARKIISDLGLPINRRETIKAIKAEVKFEKVGDDSIPTVVIQKEVIYKPLPQDGKTAEERAIETAASINRALDSGLKMHQLKADPTGGVLIKNKPIIIYSDDEAKLLGLTPDIAAKNAAQAIRKVLLAEMMDTVL